MKLENFKEEKEALCIKEYANNYPDKWDYFINFIDYCNKVDWIPHSEDEVKAFMQSGRLRKGALQLWGYFTMLAENPLTQPGIMTNIDLLEQQIFSDFNQKPLSSFAIVNLSNAENITGRHNDLTHNFYIQCIGSVVWKIYESTSSSVYKEHTLIPGDAILVPAGVSHEVVALQPRAAITLAFN